MKFWEGRIFAVFHKLETRGGGLQNCLSLCPVAASCLSHGSILLCDDCWKSSWVTDEIQFLFPTLKGAVEKQTSLTFLIHSPKGEHMHGKHLHPHTPSFAPSSSGDPLLWSLSLEKERAVPFGASVWNSCCLPAQWVFTPVSPLREWLVATSLRAVRCQQKAHRVGTYKPNSPVSFISNQPDILIFHFSPYLSWYQTRRM